MLEKAFKVLVVTVICAMAGLFISLAIAWTMQGYLENAKGMLRPVRERAFGPGEESDRWLIDNTRYSNGVRYTRVHSLHGSPESYYLADGSVAAIERLGPSFVPKWSRASNVSSGEEPRGYMLIETVSGWPQSSWYGAYERQSESANMAVLVQSGRFQDHPLLLPLFPLFPQVITQALAYGLCFFAGIHSLKGVFLVRVRIRRRRKGLCSHCAYDISGLTSCPECGRPVESKQP